MSEVGKLRWPSVDKDKGTTEKASDFTHQEVLARPTEQFSVVLSTKG